MVVTFEAADLTLRGRGASALCMNGAGVSLRFIIIAEAEGVVVLEDIYDVGS